MSTHVIPCSVTQGDQSPLIKAPPRFRLTRHLPGPARDDVVAVAKRMSIARARRAPFSLRFAFHFIWLSIAVHTARVTETNCDWIPFELFMPNSGRHTENGLVRPRGEGEEKKVANLAGPSLSYSHSVNGRIRKVLARDDQRDGGRALSFSCCLARPSSPSELK